jgi:DNA polymerase I-like protein with 3'-5' exonuclease and polymerase domains
MNIILDIETDGLLDVATRVHCVCCRSLSGQTWSFGPDRLDDAMKFLHKADVLIGHNLIGFDIPALDLLLGWKPKPHQRILDTLVLSRLAWPDISTDDWRRVSADEYPKTLVGRHSLKAWGFRLGMRKDDWGETTDWKECSPEMISYCLRDTEVTLELWNAIKGERLSKDAVALEHDFSREIHRMQENGFAFDRDSAVTLCQTLGGRKEELLEQLQQTFPPRVEVLKTKTKTHPFNPGSRMDIARGLRELRGWQPKDFTADGRPKVDEAVLSQLDYPEAKLLLEYLMVLKRLGQVATGDEAWMKLVREDGRIYGSVNPNGALTGRCTHRRPNMAQVPGNRSPYGKECRGLFIAPPGRTLVGADASGLELRCLAHYMAAYDGGAYATVLVEGDIHTANQKAAGLDTRDQAKVFIYAFLYGAGDAKLGTIVGGAAKEGKSLKQKFLKRTPALKTLREQVEKASRDRGFLIGLDGRRLPIRSSHAALNTLLQSAGAVLMKAATVDMARELDAIGFDWRLVAHVHDEVQIEAPEGMESEVGGVAVAAIRGSGRRFNFRCPLDGEWRSGSSWSATH